MAKSTPSPKTVKSPQVDSSKTNARQPQSRPAVGYDKTAAKKYGKSSWNNGYTN